MKLIWDVVKSISVPLWTLIVLALTPIINMLHDKYYRNKRISFLYAEMFSGFISITIANPSQKRIQIRTNYYSIKNDPNHHIKNFKLDLSEEDQVAFAIDYPPDKKIADLISVTLVDSTNKRYSGYLYGGKFRNWWIVQLFRFRDRIIPKKEVF